MSIAFYLRNLRHAPLAADQPPHSGKIEDADPQPVPHAVIGDARAARTVDHVDIANVNTLAAHEGRCEPPPIVRRTTHARPRAATDGSPSMRSIRPASRRSSRR